MAQTLEALAGILLKSIPTIFLLLLLHFYLKAMLFGPLERVLKQRDELTKGARKTAADSLAAAERKTLEYETKMREARAEVYREQEELRRKWLADQSAQVDEARERTAQVVRKAKEQIAAEAAAARQSLTETAGALAEEIATAVLARKAEMEQAG
jgi:F-type H+-transporting ATPase subunit b